MQKSNFFKGLYEKILYSVLVPPTSLELAIDPTGNSLVDTCEKTTNSYKELGECIQSAANMQSAVVAIGVAIPLGIVALWLYRRYRQAEAHAARSDRICELQEALLGVKNSHEIGALDKQAASDLRRRINAELAQINK